MIGIREEWVDIILHFIINKWREKSEIQQGRLTRGRSVCRIIHVKKAEIAIANLIQQNDHLGGAELERMFILKSIKKIMGELYAEIRSQNQFSEKDLLGE